MLWKLCHRKKYYLLLILFFSTIYLSAQDRKEWLIQIPDTSEISDIRGIYDDRGDDRQNVYYTAGQGLKALKEKNINYKVLQHPNQKIDKNDFNKKRNLSFPLETYPSYPEYDSLMSAFAQNYPSICRLDTFAVLPSGKNLLMLVVDNQPDVTEDEPAFLYTSTIHGNETGGYIMMLNLIDTLLENYGKIPRITQLLNEVKICINPLANPDGLYAANNTSVSGATRTNASGVDLNRNFPDPEAGQHPDGYNWQPETKAFMDLADSMNFAMSSNIHSGAELVNYPWDTWDHTHANEDWWIKLGKEYADTAQAYSSAGYFSSFQFPEGYTNGYDWYSISGGRQDYMNYFHSCREMTLEIANQKILPENELKQLWDANKRSLLNYLERATYGVSGIVTDSISGDSLKAKVYVDNFDVDSSHVYSRASDGYYHRYFAPGNYDLTFSASGYETKKMPVSIVDSQIQNIDVELAPKDNSIDNQKKLSINVYPNPAYGTVFIEPGQNRSSGDLQIRLYNSEGKMIKSRKYSSDSRRIQVSLDKFPSGIYLIQIQDNNNSYSQKLMVK